MTQGLQNWRSRIADYVLVNTRENGAVSAHNCIIYDTRYDELCLIDDNVEAELLVQEMYAAGVPTVPLSQFRPTPNEFGTLLNEMVDAGRSPEEINAFIKLYRHSSGDY